MEEKIDAMLKMPGEPLKEIAIPHTLKALQALVGGLIDMVQLPETSCIDAIINDEGLILGMDENVNDGDEGLRLFGPIVFAGFDQQGNTISLTAEQKEEVRKWVSKYEVRYQICCLCGKRFKGYGHNPAPLKDEGRCCDDCNVQVAEERLREFAESLI